MSERTCEHCRHWTQDAEYLEGDCAALHATMTASGRQRAVLYPADASKPARVMTLPSFGCNLWESR